MLRAQRGEGLAGAPARRGPPPASPGPGLYSGLLCPLRPQLGLPPAAVGLGWRPRLPVSPAGTHLVGDRGSRGEASAPGATRVSASPAVGALAARSAGEDAGLSSTRAGRPRSAGLPSRRHKRRFLGLFWGSMKQAFRAKCPSHNSVPGPLGQLDPEQGARPRTVFQHRRKALPRVCGRFSPLRSEGSRAHAPSPCASLGSKPPRPPAPRCVLLLSYDRCSGTQTQTPEEQRLGRESPDEKVAESVSHTGPGRKSRQLPGSRALPRAGGGRVRCPEELGKLTPEPGAACPRLVRLSTPPGLPRRPGAGGRGPGAAGPGGSEGGGSSCPEDLGKSCPRLKDLPKKFEEGTDP